MRFLSRQANGGTASGRNTQHRRGKVEHHFTVTYDAGNYWSVITQQLGSDWPRLLPYCLANVFLMGALHLLDARNDINLQISGQAHGFMSLIIGFLLVQRITTSLSRYDQSREHLENMNKGCRQFVHGVCFYSSSDDTDTGKAWRHDVTYRMLLLLRAAMAMVDYPSSGIPLWEVPELGSGVLEDVKNNLPPLRWLHEEGRSDFEWNMRIPVRMSYLLRKSVRSQEKVLKTPMGVFSEGDLYGSINCFMEGYYGMHKFLTTPAPFPLIQMTATFLFFFLYTVPFALLSDDTRVFTIISHCVVIFILTYGLMGMDMVAVQLGKSFKAYELSFPVSFLSPQIMLKMILLGTM